MSISEQAEVVPDDIPAPSFSDLGVEDDLVAALAERGIHSPFAIQILSIADAIAFARPAKPIAKKPK